MKRFKALNYLLSAVVILTLTTTTAAASTLPLAALTVPAMKNAQSAYDQALAQYQKGSIGFFESLKDSDPDAARAYQIMTDMSGSCQYRTDENIRPYTDPSKETDAASLENMKKAIDYIDTTNELRSQDTNLGPQPALYVTHELMAISELCCNRSAHEIFHCRAYNIGENLVWGYDDPFKAWYTNEKKDYVSGDREFEEIGHYTNLMDSKYKTTGFALTQDADYDICYEESFQYDNDNKKTVAQYRSLFNDYYNKTVNALSQSKTNLENEKSKATGHFEDVYNDIWYYDVIEEMADLGFMSGLDSTHFGPNETMSRAMTVTVLYRMAGQPDADSHSGFADVHDNLWYSKPVAWASSNGIVTGYNSSTFAPDDPVTREQLSLMVQKYLNYVGLKTTAQASLSKFKDANDVDSYAKKAMGYCVYTGIISGADNGTRLYPRNSATRAECCKMLLAGYHQYD